MKKSIWPNFLISLVVGGCIAAAMFVLCFYLGESQQDHLISVSIGLASIAVGWMFGTWISPDTAEEETRFSRLGTAMKAFVSGYLVSKMDKLVTVIFDPDNMLTNLHVFRVLLVITVVIVAALVTYILREYVLDSRTPE